jgi:hypothetical protein
MFTGKEEHKVSLKKARSMVKAYQKSKTKNEIKAVFFGKDAIGKILKQKNCVGMRVYYAKKTSGANTLVVIGVDKNCNDLTEGYIADYGFPCPPICGPDISL